MTGDPTGSRNDMTDSFLLTHQLEDGQSVDRGRDPLLLVVELDAVLERGVGHQRVGQFKRMGVKGTE